MSFSLGSQATVGNEDLRVATVNWKPINLRVIGDGETYSTVFSLLTIHPKWDHGRGQVPKYKLLKKNVTQLKLLMAQKFAKLISAHPDEIVNILQIAHKDGVDSGRRQAKEELRTWLSSD